MYYMKNNMLHVARSPALPSSPSLYLYLYGHTKYSIANYPMA